MREGSEFRIFSVALHVSEFGKTYIQPLPDMNEDHFMTKRLVSYIEREVFKRTFTAMAAEIGVDEKTIRNVFNEYVEREEKKRVILAPYWLGIDDGILRDQQAYYMFPPARPRPDYFSGVKISTLVTAIRNDHFLPISTRYSE